MEMFELTKTTKRVRFLVFSDTHDLTLHNLPDADVLLHCGDLTETCSIENLRHALNFLSLVKAELRLVIAGNHDTLLDRHFMSFHGGNMEAHQKSVDLMSSIPGITYLEEGTHRFTLSNGAFFTIHASPCTPSQYGSQYMLHAFQYATGEDRYNPNADTDGIGMTPSWAVNSSTPSSTIPTFPGVDIVMTQSPPKYILDHTSDGSSAGCEHLRRAISRAKPRLHCFGHIHKSYGAERIAWKSHMTHKELEDMGIECLEDFDDDIAPLPQQEPDGLMKNSSRKRGFARISQQSQDALVHGKQTLCVNAAVKEDEGRPSNAPWLVTLELPCIPTRAWNED